MVLAVQENLHMCPAKTDSHWYDHVSCNDNCLIAAQESSQPF